MKIRFLVVLAFAAIVFTGNAQTVFQDEVKVLLQKPEYRNATVGIVIADAKTGERLFELNPDQLMIPASTLKIVTTATALEMLGADYRFETKTGFTGAIDETGTLHGDLVIVSGGDPTLGSAWFNTSKCKNWFLKDWVEQIIHSGIKEIKGNVVLDGSLYHIEEVPPTWVWGDIGNYYGANASAFTVYDNLFTITFRSGKAGEKTEIIQLEPNLSDLKIDNRVLSSEINSDQAYVFGSPMDNNRIIRGTIPKEKKAFSIKASIPNSAALLGVELLSVLKAEGIKIGGTVVQDSVENVKIIHVHQSPTLTEIVKTVNHESVNLFAEHLLLQLSAEKTGVGSREKSIELVQQFWNEKGFNVSSLFMEDGSGLSHFNAISPAFITSVLVDMKSSKNSVSFVESLPNAGEGTLSSFSTQKFPGNTLSVKSGSMTRVRCYAGYLKTSSGKEIAFSIMFNHFSGSQSKLRAGIENLLSTL
ncbi:MAG TPA: D-alanyl-D-alanine carboxypeptidase/D-alanyl-D-alanine-endopeptidase [Prolixibacteraceae bacterium]|nr:D-alanyl-D-alanine carboxypeptidase/D-alanyl-D-alanine-endopeptidase [Prolixibacteraceae bacterium]